MKGRRITKKQVSEMKRLISRGMSRTQVSKHTEISYAAVCHHLRKYKIKAKAKPLYSLYCSKESFEYVKGLADIKNINMNTMLDRIITKDRRKWWNFK